MGAPQIIIISLVALGGGISMSQHGKPKTGKENFFAYSISAAIQLGIMYWGGFFG